MDPDANLKELLTLAKSIGDANAADLEADADRMAELILALDEWIKRGGFLPRRWERKP